MITVPKPEETTRRCPFAPPAEYEELREKAEIGQFELPSGRSAYLLTRSEEVMSALTNPHLSSEVNSPPPLPNGEPTPAWFFGMDGSEHAAYRRALTKWFTTRAAERLVPAITAAVDELLDNIMESTEPVDLVKGLLHE